MDTHRIRYFLSLARTGSITRAAELHGISAPAFSKAMRVLEGEVGRKLLVPHGRGILLTDQARELVPELAEVIRRLDSIRNEGSSGQVDRSAPKVLKLATFEVFSTYFLEKVLSSGMSDFACAVHEMVPGKMEAAVASGVVDLALSYLPIPHPDLDFLKVAPIAMGIYGKEAFEGQDYRKLRFAAPVTPVEGSPNRVQGLDGWPDGAFPRQIVYRVQLLQTALGLCRRGLAVAYLPRFVARLHNETVKSAFALKELKTPPGFPSRKEFVYLIKRKSDWEGEAARKVAAAIRQICPG